MSVSVKSPWESKWNCFLFQKTVLEMHPSDTCSPQNQYRAERELYTTFCPFWCQVATRTIEAFGVSQSSFVNEYHWAALQTAAVPTLLVVSFSFHTQPEHIYILLEFPRGNFNLWPSMVVLERYSPGQLQCLNTLLPPMVFLLGHSCYAQDQTENYRVLLCGFQGSGCTEISVNF